MCYLIGQTVEINQKKIDHEHLENKEENVAFYGVGDSQNIPYNQKVIRREENDILKIEEPIIVTFDPINKQVSFESRAFEYYQENIVEGVSYRIAIAMGVFPQIVEL